MIEIEINKERYNIPSGWGDISLKTYIAYCKTALSKTPEILQKIQAEKKAAKRKELYNSITENMYDLELLPHFARTVSALSDVPITLLFECEVEQVERLYNMLLSTLKQPEYSYQNSIEIQGQTFYFPEKLMMKSTLGEYVEAAQYEKVVHDANGNEMEAIAKVACCILKKQGEKFSGEVTLEREPFFLNMPMDAAWRISFFLQKRNAILQPLLAIVLAQQKALKLQQE